MIKLNSKEVKMGLFPNGEKSYHKETIVVNEWETNIVQFKFEGNESLMDLYFIMQHIKYNKGQYNLTVLYMGYMPYSRMDRDSKEYLFTLNYIKDLFGTFGKVDVVIDEPHSEVTLAVLNTLPLITAEEEYVTIKLGEKLLREKGLDETNTVLVLPDAGATKRYGSLLRDSTSPLADLEQINIEKRRDFATGKILSIDIAAKDANKSVEGMKAIIIDDLCSRGGTFLGAAVALREMGITEIYLVVTHCEETILEGYIPTSDLITEVHTTNSIISDNKGIKKIKIDF